MASDSKKQEIQQRIVQFVNQTQNKDMLPISFNHYCLANPDFKGIEKKDAVILAMKLLQKKELSLVTENDTIDIPTVDKILEMVRNKEEEKVIEEYSRLLARCDLMGAFFSKDEDILGTPDQDAIKEISDFIYSINYDQRQVFIENLNTYLVSN